MGREEKEREVGGSELEKGKGERQRDNGRDRSLSCMQVTTGEVNWDYDWGENMPYIAPGMVEGKEPLLDEWEVSQLTINFNYTLTSIIVSVITPWLLSGHFIILFHDHLTTNPTYLRIN